MPNPSISSFIANFAGGGARPNLYEVILTFPAALPNVFASEKLSFTCTAATLPSSTIEPAQVFYMGRTVKLAGDRSFEDWNITVMNDTDFAVRDALEDWSNRISSHSGNRTATGWSNPTNYFADALVIQYGREREILKTVKMEGIFPLQIGEIQLGFDQQSQIEVFQVMFAVNYWSSSLTN
jgi:hypothetical protein